MAPTGLIAKTGLELLTMSTPNGVKATIMLEELREAYHGKPEYVAQAIDISENTQKEPWFTKHCPNGRIPVLIDHDHDDLSIMEGSAILSYLARKYDPEHKFSFVDDPDLAKCEQWLGFQHGGVGPMQGQANHFYRLAKERIPYPTQRYVGETERLYGVLNTQLSKNTYLVGEKYSIADIATWGWVNIAGTIGIDIEEQFPDLHRWWKLIRDRPAVQRGSVIPTRPKRTTEGDRERRLVDPEFKKQTDELKALADEAKRKYNYTYKSP